MSYISQDIITQVQNKIGDTSFSSPDLLQYINHINRDIHNTYQLRYMQAKQGYTIVPNATTFGALPADLQMAYNLRRTDIAYAGIMPFLTFEEFDERYPQPTLQAPSIPQLWYEYGGVGYTYPAASAPSGLSGFAVELRYLKKPTTLTAATQTPDVPEEFQECLTLGALKHAMERRQRFDVSQLYEQQYQSKVLELVQRYAVGGFSDSDVYIMGTPTSRMI